MQEENLQGSDNKKELFTVRYETPDDFKMLAEDLKERFKLPAEVIEKLPDDETCLHVAACLRVTTSENPKYKDEEFMGVMKKYFEVTKEEMGRDFGARVAYFLLGTVAEFEDNWKRKFTDEEMQIRKRVELGEEGLEIPQGERVDLYEIGEVSGELLNFGKNILTEHLKTTESIDDVMDVANLLTRATEYADEGFDSENTYLKVADCQTFLDLIDQRSEKFKEMHGENWNKVSEKLNLVRKRLK